MKKIEYYVTEKGKCPYLDWYKKLNVLFRVQISNRIDRLQEGSYGDCKRLKNTELSEIRIHSGRGYRIYFKEFKNTIILIFAGSDKSNQERTIKQANKYLQEYIKRGTNNEKH